LESIEKLKATDLDIKIINLVKERPALYNYRIDRTREIKQALWQEISDGLEGQLNANAVSRRWRYLRQRYMKSRIKKKKREEKVKRIGLPPKSRKNKKYFFTHHEIMEFLEETITHEPGAGRIIYPKDYKKVPKIPNIIKRVVPIAPKPLAIQVNNTDLQTNLVATNSVDNVGPFTFVHIPSIPSPQNPVEIIANDNASNISDEPKNTVTDYDKIFLECLQRPIEQPSPIEGFLIRLGEGLKKLPYRERSKLELEFLQRLYEVEEQLEKCDENKL